MRWVAFIKIAGLPDKNETHYSAQEVKQWLLMQKKLIAKYKRIYDSVDSLLCFVKGRFHRSSFENYYSFLKRGFKIKRLK